MIWSNQILSWILETLEIAIMASGLEWCIFIWLAHFHNTVYIAMDFNSLLLMETAAYRSNNENEKK